MNKTKKHLITFGIVTLMIIASSSPALATPIPPVLDQAQELSNGGSAFFDTSSLAQTFTPDVTAQLVRVDLDVGDSSHFPDPTHPATISIVETVVNDDGGLENGYLEPGTAVLAAVNLTGFTVGWNQIDFSGQSVFLDAGTTYAIVLENDDANKDLLPTDSLRIQWTGDPYAGGRLWERTADTGLWYWPAAMQDSGLPTPAGDADGAFRTYMVPEPAALALLIAPAFLVLRRKRKG